jgi:hypothetical protein
MQSVVAHLKRVTSPVCDVCPFQPTAPVAVGVATLRQVQLTEEKAVKGAASETHMDCDDAVFGLTQAAGPLFLNAGSVVPYPDVARLVDVPDRVWAGMLDRRVLLQPISHPFFVTLELAEEPFPLEE